MKSIFEYNFWFLTGSQHLYGEDALKEVEKDSGIIVDKLNSSGVLPCKIIYKAILVDSQSIEKTIMAADSDTDCAGIICWMHTFSPAKMWINGLRALSKPMLQINTQFNVKIPYRTMDMDFMNLNQSAHGDREFGHITSRMDIPRSVIAGHYENSYFQQRLAKWMRAAAAAVAGRNLTIVRFGDNMRDVAVTDGDKVEAMIKLGWSVPCYGIGDLVEEVNQVTDAEIDSLMNDYKKLYSIAEHDDQDFALGQIREQAKLEVAIEKFLIKNSAEAFTTNFQDLHGLNQLPGLACQHLMAKGYGFAGEGDWKTAAMVRTLKMMGEDLDGGCSFMEDYTYNLEDGKMYNLGAHMLEICPSITGTKPSIEVHPLGIGDRKDPARLVFDAKAGSGFTCSIVDMGSRFRIVTNEVELIDAPEKFEKLPVARALWKPLPDFLTATEAWILSGAGHHNTLTTALDIEYIQYYAEIVRIEHLAIDSGTSIRQFRNEDRWNRGYYAG